MQVHCGNMKSYPAEVHSQLDGLDQLPVPISFINMSDPVLKIET